MYVVSLSLSNHTKPTQPHNPTTPPSPEEQPTVHYGFVHAPGGPRHDVPVWLVEAERGGGEAVRHQVDPQELLVLWMGGWLVGWLWWLDLGV